MSEKVRTVLAELRRRLESLYGDRLVHLVLYGSQARGDARSGSDIDVLVVLKGPVNSAEEIDRTLGTVSDLSLQFAEVITCLFMDEHRYNRQRGPLLRNIHREGLPV